MRTFRLRGVRFSPAAMGVALLALALAPAARAGDPKFSPFQFDDQYLLEQGVDVNFTLDHFVFPDAAGRTALGTPPDDPRYNDVRVIETTGGYMHNGNLLFYMAPSKLMPETVDENGNVIPSSFTDNAAGETQRTICNTYKAFMFPKKDGNPVGPAPANRRQDNIFETNNGYFSNNPLGCWRLTFVSWDGPNAAGQRCEGHREDLMEDNGPSLDADTPIIKTLSTINKLAQDGCVTLRQRSETGDDGFPWVI
ncbi:MAG TPA: hypothetical protein VLF66_08255 [Thermoanaerobaculia bacterium]|nr:hypothetical protein [Thermoanaerobaculia bacterium]